MTIDYYGRDLPLKLLEIKGLKVEPEHRQGEARLMRRRWYDYRHMHPVQATYFYAECYRLQTLKHYETCVDIRTMDMVSAFKPDDIFMSRDMTSMWLARGFADEHSLPYPFVLRFAQDRFFSRVQHNFPRPNQLYGEEFEIDLKDAWKEQLARQITYSSEPEFSISAWKGDLSQAQHIHFVVEQVKARQAPRHRLLARLLNEDVLSTALIAIHFSQKEAADAEQYCREFM